MNFLKHEEMANRVNYHPPTPKAVKAHETMMLSSARRNEDLLAIVVDRLEHFQAGGFACEHNEKALACIKTAMDLLNQRTQERRTRGVEGTSQT